MSERSDLTVGSLLVRLADLPASRQLSFGPRFIETAIGTLPMRAALERPKNDEQIGAAASSVELYEGSPGVFVRGSLSGHLEIACSRCVEAVSVDIEEEIAVSFLPASDVPEDEADEDEVSADTTTEDVDLYPYEGEQIDLTRLFVERLIMSVPFAPLCSDGCKGLCSVCGKNLNDGECGCDRHVGDPRLAALRDIKLSGTS